MAYFRQVKAKNKKGYTWSFTIDLGRDEYGKRKQVTRRGFSTKKLAEEASATMQHEIKINQHVVDTNMILKEYFDKWIDLYAKRKLRDTTLVSYKQAINYRILPILGNEKIASLTTPKCQRFINDLIDEGLSARYVEYISVILYGALRKAVEWELLYKNPMENTDIPRARRRKKVTWSVEQVDRFLFHAKYSNPNYYIAFLVDLYTGLRRGELLGLKKADLDFDDNIINVERSLIYDKSGFRFGPLKNQSSYRLIKVDDFVMDELRRHLIRQSEMKLYLGQEYAHDLDLMFCREDGRPIYPRTFTTIFNRIIKKSEVPKIRVHDMRHTHATLFLESGGTLKEAQERLGHKSISTTGDIYAHVTPKMKDKSSIQFGEYLRQ